MLKRKSMNTHTHTELYKFFQCGYVHVHLCHLCVCVHVCMRTCVCACVCVYMWYGCKCAHALVCRHFCGCVCIEGAVYSPACVSAVFSVLLSVTTAKWLDKNQTDLSHSCICIQEDNGLMLGSAWWGHHLVEREKEKQDKEGKLKVDRDGVKKKHKRWRDQSAINMTIRCCSGVSREWKGTNSAETKHCVCTHKWALTQAWWRDIEDNAAHSSLKTSTQTTGGKQLQAAAEQVKETLARRTHNLFTQNSFSSLIIPTLCSYSWLEEMQLESSTLNPIHYWIKKAPFTLNGCPFFQVPLRGNSGCLLPLVAIINTAPVIWTWFTTWLLLGSGTASLHLFIAVTLEFPHSSVLSVPLGAFLVTAYVVRRSP